MKDCWKHPDVSKPHLYMVDGSWFYVSAWLGNDYINGPSEIRNNAAMIWCFLKNQKPLPVDMQHVLLDNLSSLYED